ncbi:WD40/YVTN/BNR-like repeat-containing protein [Pseudonocardia sp. RS010]|uniref:WD40/YVTN/BNR-like repeat-containing protein n=1 Tax=Pseudonocardia sp. RS010 TaxID=3385979 RepID=UPI0039A1DC45
MAVNPGDGLVYVATHGGLFRIEASGAVRVSSAHHDLMGFAVTGPGEFLASGHPDPENPVTPAASSTGSMGLVRSHDSGGSWSAVSLDGAADLHAIAAAGPVVYGWDSATARVLRSEDAGATWQPGAQGDLTDLAVDTKNPRRVWAATPQGLAESLDGGQSFQLTTSDAATEPPLVFLDAVPALHGDQEPDLVGVDAIGGVWGRFRDGWRATGKLGSPPTAWSATGPDRYLAATTTAVVSSEDAGRTWTPLAPVSR